MKGKTIYLTEYKNQKNHGGVKENPAIIGAKGREKEKDSRNAARIRENRRKI